MKRILLATLLCLSTSVVCSAQQTASDTRATKEDIQKYLEAIHSREVTMQMIDAMAKPQRQFIHEQYLKNKDKLPPDFEDRMTAEMDRLMKSFPWDEMLQATVPVYQEHFTKGDVNALVAFYGTPTGQKILRELPAIMSESMQAMMPLLQKQLDAMTEHMQQQVAQMMKGSKDSTGKSPQTTPN